MKKIGSRIEAWKEHVLHPDAPGIRTGTIIGFDGVLRKILWDSGHISKIGNCLLYPKGHHKDILKIKKEKGKCRKEV